jgi:extracellular elastinolytic metalloproteinase
MADYSANAPNGIRMYPYTTDMKIDPETYGYINLGNYTGVHAKGEVWCGILWETYWNFVDFWGFAPDVYEGQGGNNRILQNVVDGLKIQPCNPNFVTARDAIFAADLANYNSENYCRLWTGFAKRGLGVNAVPGAPNAKQDFTVPPECM